MGGPPQRNLDPRFQLNGMRDQDQLGKDQKGFIKGVRILESM